MSEKLTKNLWKIRKHFFIKINNFTLFFDYFRQNSNLINLKIQFCQKNVNFFRLMPIMFKLENAAALKSNEDSELPVSKFFLLKN